MNSLNRSGFQHTGHSHTRSYEAVCNVVRLFVQVGNPDWKLLDKRCPWTRVKHSVIVCISEFTFSWIILDYYKCVTKLEHNIKFCVKLQGNVTKTFDKLTQANGDQSKRLQSPPRSARLIIFREKFDKKNYH